MDGFSAAYSYQEGYSSTLLCAPYESIEDVLDNLAKAGACPESAVVQAKGQEKQEQYTYS